MEGLKGEEEGEEMSLILSGVKMVEKIKVSDLSHPGATMDNMRILGQKQ